MPKKKSPQPIPATATRDELLDELASLLVTAARHKAAEERQAAAARSRFGPQLLEEFTQRVLDWTREHHPERLLPPQAQTRTERLGAILEAYHQEQLQSVDGNVRLGPAEVKEDKDARYT